MAYWVVSGHYKVPVTVTVEADTPADATEIGKDLIRSGHGYENDDQTLADEYTVFDLEKREWFIDHVGHG
jgi:hypothetical protein